MRRIITIETLDPPDVVIRASGDLGDYSRCFADTESLLAFVRYLLTAPEGDSPGAISFLMQALPKQETAAIERKTTRQTLRTPLPDDATTLPPPTTVGVLRDAEDFPRPMATTVKTPRWAGPRLTRGGAS